MISQRDFELVTRRKMEDKIGIDRGKHANTMLNFQKKILGVIDFLKLSKKTNSKNEIYTFIKLF